MSEGDVAPPKGPVVVEAHNVGEEGKIAMLLLQLTASRHIPRPQGNVRQAPLEAPSQRPG